MIGEIKFLIGDQYYGIGHVFDEMDRLKKLEMENYELKCVIEELKRKYDQKRINQKTDRARTQTNQSAGL